MDRTRIKICGVCTPETAVAAAAAGADAIGLVFAQHSPRVVSIDMAIKIVRSLPAFVQPVGLFVDIPVARVQEVAAAVGLGTVQLHGNETPDQAAQLAPLRVIKAIPFDPKNAAAALAPWKDADNHLAGLLWDTPAKGNSFFQSSGGSGQQFDWNALADFQQDSGLENPPPTILAGGLTPQNVAQAISTLSPYAVDVSSGVESSRGVKDVSLIEAFCQAVHRADQARQADSHRKNG